LNPGRLRPWPLPLGGWPLPFGGWPFPLGGWPFPFGGWPFPLGGCPFCGRLPAGSVTPCFCRHERVFASRLKKPRRPPWPCCWLAFAEPVDVEDDELPQAVTPRAATSAHAQAHRRGESKT
jgi:hypothetical protein